jgi:hypothetical protein
VIVERSVARNEIQKSPAGRIFESKDSGFRGFCGTEETTNKRMIKGMHDFDFRRIARTEISSCEFDGHLRFRRLMLNQSDGREGANPESVNIAEVGKKGRETMHCETDI